MTENTNSLNAREKKWALWCYLPFFNFISCAIAAVRIPESVFCRFHVRQGLIVFAIWFVTVLISFLSDFIGLILWFLVFLIYLTCLFLIYSDKDARLPVVSNLAKIIPEFFLFRFLTSKEPREEWLSENKNTDLASNDAKDSAAQSETRNDNSDGGSANNDDSASSGDSGDSGE